MNFLITLHALTPLHVGSGQAVGATDLPIIREKATGWPVVPGSSIKGSIKDHHKSRLLNGGARTEELGKKLDRDLAFLYGSPDANESAAGMISLSDARCLLFPVRSFKGAFVYATCPFALRRVAEFARACNIGLPEIPTIADDNHAIVGSTSLLYNDHLLLEDLDLKASAQDLSVFAPLLGEDKIDHLAILSDTVFSYFCETATEVITHVSLNFETKTAREKFLRSEERVPCEAVFAGLAVLDTSMHEAHRQGAKEEIQQMNGSVVQFGGKASTGAGLCKVGLIQGAPN